MLLAIAKYHQETNAWAPGQTGFYELRSIQALVEDKTTWESFKEESKKYPFSEVVKSKRIFKFGFVKY